MSKSIQISEKLAEQLNRLKREFADEDTGKLASYNKVITRCVKESGHWKGKKQLSE